MAQSKVETSRSYRLRHPGRSNESSNRSKKNNRLAAGAYLRNKRGCPPITETEFLELLEYQEHKCAICGRELVWPSKATHIDHDHQTKKIRGILCNRCNMGTGLLNDDPATLKKAAAYIESHGWENKQVGSGMLGYVDVSVCWHCLVVLAEPVKPYCEDCPIECDKENCDQPGCTD